MEARSKLPRILVKFWQFYALHNDDYGSAQTRLVCRTVLTTTVLQDGVITTELRTSATQSAINRLRQNAAGAQSTIHFKIYSIHDTAINAAMADIKQRLSCAFSTVLGSRVAKELDLQLAGCEFNSWPRRCQVTTLGKLFTPTCLSRSHGGLAMA